MRHIILLMTCLIMLPVGAGAGELFRWVDENGKVHYGDAPPAKAAKVERKKFGGNVEQNEELSYEARRAQQNFPVVLYVGETCIEPCIHARALLKKRGVPFSEKMLRTKTEIDEFYKLSGSYDSPTLAVGKKYLKGFQDSAWNTELDVAGYPKTATYRQRIAPPPAEPQNPPPAEGQPANGQPAANDQTRAEGQAAPAATPAQ